jgi:hypothetical protein
LLEKLPYMNYLHFSFLPFRRVHRGKDRVRRHSDHAHAAHRDPVDRHRHESPRLPFAAAAMME